MSSVTDDSVKSAMLLCRDATECCKKSIDSVSAAGAAGSDIVDQLTAC